MFSRPGRRRGGEGRGVWEDMEKLIHI